jgi:hypothetical protein
VKCTSGLAGGKYKRIQDNINALYFCQNTKQTESRLAKKVAMSAESQNISSKDGFQVIKRNRELQWRNQRRETI